MRVHWPGEPDFFSPAAWDEFAGSHPQGHLLQSWAWGDFKGHFGWRPFRVAGVTLFSSTLTPQGPLYERIRECRF